MATNSSYPELGLGASLTYPYRPIRYGEDERGEDPSVRTAAVRSMEPNWTPIDIVTGGTAVLRDNAKTIIPQEPSEADAAYKRRIFHATMAPFLQRLASQAAGIILRKGIQLDGPDYWQEWSKDVTGDGTTLDEYARRQLVTALLWGHSSSIVDFNVTVTPRDLAEERGMGGKPYLVPVHPRNILGWRTASDSWSSALTQVRILEQVIEPQGRYGEEVLNQIRILEPGRYELWRTSTDTSSDWTPYRSDTTSLDEIPLVTLYSNRLGNLLSRPPLLEVAQLNIAYAQRFCDYHHSIHVGANPMLVLRGFDPDSEAPLGISVNTALLLPPDGGAEYVQPTSEAFDSQLKCLQALEDQISRLGINTLTAQNVTNAAAEARRMDRIDSDSIMAVIAGDLERTIEQMLRLAGEYAGVAPPTVTIPRDYDSRLVSGNEITAYLQLFMQGAISQETLLEILKVGEVIPPWIDTNEEIIRTRDALEEQQAMAAINGPDLAFQNAGQGEDLASQTLPTPMRPGRNA